MSEEDHVRKWLDEVELELAERAKYRRVVEDLISALYRDIDVRSSPRSEAMLEIMSNSIRYAYACVAQYEGSEGIKSKMRSRVNDALRRWCNGGEHG